MSAAAEDAAVGAAVVVGRTERQTDRSWKCSDVIGVIGLVDVTLPMEYLLFHPDCLTIRSDVGQNVTSFQRT